MEFEALGLQHLLFKIRIMINQKESNAISILRVMAMFSIVTCHILQGLDNRWAWILNVGVQVFFVMSGYLYGNKQIEDWKKWYTKRIRKLYIPFILFASFGLLAYGLFTDTNIGIKNICAYIFNIQGLIGGGERFITSVVYDGYCSLLYPNSFFTAFPQVW